VTGDHSPSQIREEFWAQLIDRLHRAGYRPSRRGNYCYLRLGVANTQLVLTAPTGGGGVECKLSLAGAVRARTLTPEEIFEQLHENRDAIEACVSRGPLEWGSGKSRTRVYLRRAADLGDRRTWEETSEWLIGSADDFTRVFRPHVVAITSPRPVADPARAPRRRGVKTGAAAPAHQARRARATLVAHEPGETSNRLPAARDDDGDIGLDTRLKALADRFGLVLRRPPSAHGQAWSLEAPPERSGDHLHRYAYALWWRTRGPARLDEMVAWVMLNPSTGDTDNKPRPTLGYCRNRTRLDWKHGGLLILNLFAYRVTGPSALYRLPREICVGPWNDQILLDLAPRCPLAVAAWGHHGSLHGRSREVIAVLPDLHAVVNRDGQRTGEGGEPSHPRWLPKIPVLYRLGR
jgi:hypothetical protein